MVDAHRRRLELYGLVKVSDPVSAPMLDVVLTISVILEAVMDPVAWWCQPSLASRICWVCVCIRVNVGELVSSVLYGGNALVSMVRSALPSMSIVRSPSPKKASVDSIARLVTVRGTRREDVAPVVRVSNAVGILFWRT